MYDAYTEAGRNDARLKKFQCRFPRGDCMPEPLIWDVANSELPKLKLLKPIAWALIDTFAVLEEADWVPQETVDAVIEIETALLDSIQEMMDQEGCMLEKDPYSKFFSRKDS